MGERKSLPSVQESFANLWGWNEYMDAKADFGLFMKRF
jgi:hypothetical protein